MHLAIKIHLNQLYVILMYIMQITDMNGVVFVFFLIYAEAIYRRGSIVNGSCLPFSMGMKKKFHNEKGFKGTTGL